MMKKEKIILALLRISLGWIFFWPFLDKLFGLGFSTKPENAWLLGVSPTTGFLQFAVKGPFASLFQKLAGLAWVDWLFMFGILLIGLALILGIGIRIAAYSGMLLLLLMWLATLQPEHNPLIDEHIIYALLLLLLYKMKAGEIFGLGKWWSSTKLVRRYNFLE